MPTNVHNRQTVKPPCRPVSQKNDSNLTSPQPRLSQPISPPISSSTPRTPQALATALNDSATSPRPNRPRPRPPSRTSQNLFSRLLTYHESSPCDGYLLPFEPNEPRTPPREKTPSSIPNSRITSEFPQTLRQPRPVPFQKQ